MLFGLWFCLLREGDSLIGVKTRLAFALLLVVILPGCTVSTITTSSPFVEKEKTIAVPAGGGLDALVKSALKNNGWVTRVDLTSLLSNKKNLARYYDDQLKPDTQYTLLTAYKTKVCITCDCVRWYRASITDNTTGEIMFEIERSSKFGVCYADVLDAFIDRIAIEGQKW